MLFPFGDLRQATIDQRRELRFLENFDLLQDFIDDRVFDEDREWTGVVKVVE